MSCVYTRGRYIICMIKSFADKETEKVFNQEFSRKLPENIQKVALRKLMIISGESCLFQ